MKVKPPPKTSEYGSKIKDIFIELHNYAFYHSPSEINNGDRRFIGRKRILEKLKALLTNSETKSGAYLITGFRGMGKTSLVNKVISEISGDVISRGRSMSYLRIVLLLLFICFLDIQEHFILLFWVPFSLFIFSFFYLFYSDSFRDNLGLYHNGKRGRRFWQVIGRMFYLKKDKVADDKFRLLVQNYFLTSVIHLLGYSLIYVCWGSCAFLNHFLLYLLIFLLFIGYGFIVDSHTRYKGEASYTAIINRLGEVSRFLKRKINYSQKVIIRISLSHEELKTKDIFRLVAKQIHSKYSHIKGFSLALPFRIPFRLLSFLLFYLCIGLLYYFEPIYYVSLTLKEELGILHYLPSQQLPIYSAREKIDLSDKVVHYFQYTESHEAKKWVEFNDYRLYLADSLGLSQFHPDLSYSISKGQLYAIYLDYYIQLAYYHIKHLLSSNLLGRDSFRRINTFDGFMSIKVAHSHFMFIPPYLDYFFWLSFCLMVGFVRLMMGGGYLGIPSHTKIKRDLEDLVDRINAEVQVEKSINGGGGMSQKLWRFPFHLGFSRRRSKAYPIADVREIESEILRILDQINLIPPIFFRPEFIFIFDELDKIEPHGNISLGEKEAEDSLDSERIRQRQQKIAKILANMKHFLNTAKAKFIFIAGREMYDASLADISDRESFVGSIFHDVIYVNSFLTDASDDKKSDVTSMTEAYVCQFLLPPDYQGEFSLKSYNQYLKDEFFPANSPLLLSRDKSILQIKRQKIIFLLQNFITYLTYRSNGAPKKITRLFEHYVSKPDFKEFKKQERNFVVGRNARNLYLHFPYHAQYSFGFITYLITPFLLGINRFHKDFGDKLLVSSSFLIDHLYKFHNFGFAWRNLELVPEIIDINKAPELRGFIYNIMQYISRTHIQHIVSGLYDFKFQHKITSEIDYLSKISERESAAFNFTLDESLEVKQHYNRKFRLLQERHAVLKRQGEAYLHSIDLLLMILGDLHYYDQEYDDAIIHYRDTIQPLKKDIKDSNHKDEFKFIVLVRNMLKLGLTYERKKTYNSAFMLYGEIVKETTKARNLAIGKFGLKEVWLTWEDARKLRDRVKTLKISIGADWRQRYEMPIAFKNKKVLLVIQDSAEQERIRKEEHYYKHISDVPLAHFLEVHSKPGSKKTVDKLSYEVLSQVLGFSFNFDYIFRMLPSSWAKESLYHKVMTFEGVRLVYQAFIAKLHIIEKNNLGGLTPNDIERTREEFYFLVKITNRAENFLITGEFFNKLGDLLYFKNGYLETQLHTSSDEMLEGDDEKIYCHKKRSFCVKNEAVSSSGRFLKDGQEDFHNEDWQSPCSACFYYMGSLENLLYSYESGIEQGSEFDRRANILIELLDLLINRQKIMHTPARGVYMEALANNLSDIGDTFLSCSPASDTLSEEFLQLVFNCIVNARKPNEELKTHIEVRTSGDNGHRPLSKLEEVVVYYYLSSAFLLRIGSHKAYYLQLVKVLYLLDNYFAIHKDRRDVLTEDLLESIEQKVVKKALLNLYRAYDNTHRPEIERFQEIFGGRFADIPFALHNVSINADTREIILLFNELRRKSPHYSFHSELNMISPYTLISSKYNRILELRFKSRQNHQFFRELNFDQLKNIQSNQDLELLLKYKDQQLYKIFQQKISAKEAMEFFIVDSIYCLLEIVQMNKVFGMTYMTNHSNLGYTYMNLAEWCEYYEQYQDFGEEGNLRKRLEGLIGPVELISLNSNYNYEMGIQHLYLCLETHKEGQAYRDMIDKMYYLDDDFNDTLLHFCAGLERYRINAGKVREKIRLAKQKLEKGTRLYDFDQYIWRQDVRR